MAWDGRKNRPRPVGPQPATRAIRTGAVLQYSITPSLRAAGFEDSLPRRRLGGGGRTTTRTRTKRLVRAGQGPQGGSEAPTPIGSLPLAPHVRRGWPALSWRLRAGGGGGTRWSPDGSDR